MALGKEALLKGQALKRETVAIPALGDAVVLRELSLAERLRCNKRFLGVAEGDVDGAYRAAVAQVLVALCNDDGSPMVTDESELDELVPQLMAAQSSAAVEQLIAECSRMQGIAKDGIKEALGNSEGTPSGISS